MSAVIEIAVTSRRSIADFIDEIGWNAILDEQTVRPARREERESERDAT